MTIEDKLSEARSVVEAEREAVRVCKADLAEAEAHLADKKRVLSERLASLAVAERMYSIFEAQDSQPNSELSDSPKRRMRLGAKKRAIYTLVAKQVSTIDKIEAHLNIVHHTDIDRRYIRDVVRDALSSGDMQGDIDREFIITDLGRELLEKAPIPAGWIDYQDVVESNLVARRMPSMSVSGTRTAFSTETPTVASSEVEGVEQEDPFANLSKPMGDATWE